ncbi:MAG: Fe(3+) ABC transporter substrate-binding protein [Planctomycetota bacterium]
MKSISPLAFTFSFLISALMAPHAGAQDHVVNVYSSRHYDTDAVLYQQFRKDTGIQVNVIEGDTDALLTRLKREGDLSPADVFIAVDAGRLHKAVELGILRPVDSEVLSERIPENLRHPEGLWFGLSQRVRVILLSPDVPADFVTTYEGLADATLDGGLLLRSSSNIYNQSLTGSLLAHHGAAWTERWAKGVVGNFARTPQGGDRDQIRAVAAGEGEVAVANHYYFARMLTGDDADDREAASKLRLVFPNQSGRGAHVNVSGAGVLKTAPNPQNAIRFIEYLTTADAQRQYALANHEYPVVEGVELTEVLKGFGTFKSDELNAAELGHNNRAAVRVMDRAGWR